MFTLDQVDMILNHFLKMCQTHPEICPHEYEFESAYKDLMGTHRVMRCRYCGEKTEIHDFDKKISD